MRITASDADVLKACERGKTGPVATATLNLETGYPRSGREMLGRYSWLARLADKVRADHAGTSGEYMAYCGLSMGFLDCAGISREDFDALIADGASDEQLREYFDEYVDDAQREAANKYVLNDQSAHLDKQDAEEGRLHRT
jgi:hypothetical protein